MSVRTSTETLKQIPLFAECDPAHLQTMAFAGERVEFAAGTDIFRAGGSGSAAYLLILGEAEVWQAKGEGRITVATARSGAFLGELAMIAGVAYSLNVTAKSPIIATRISRDVFLRVVGEFPDFGSQVLSALSHKLTGSVSEFDRIRHMLQKVPSFPRR
jgi:CRP-like cAMP-binding protein